MTSISLILVAACLFAGSGMPGLFASRRSSWGERAAVALTTLAAALGLLGAFLPGAASGGDGESITLAWGLPWGQFSVAIDPVSRAFLLPVFLIPWLGTIYATGYWAQQEHPRNARKLRLFYGLLPAAMTIVLVARDGALMLVAWEIMAISAFLLVTTEDDQPEARRAGWVYFVAAHVGTLSLFAMFALMRSATGSFALVPIDAARAAPWIPNAVFVLAAVGFGLKAGLMPLHVWLPAAHATAPSHVSAVLSGGMLKIGIYGLIRVTSLLPVPPTWWGAVLLAAGAVSAVVGLAMALGQHDVKRLLAYSSIENIGIITVGLGLALLGRAVHEPVWVALGLGGAILHVWNHCLFKPLLFFGAGSVLHGAGSRQIDRLGGLARQMPRTAALFLIGSVALCALPPLNGFVSELTIYLGLFHTVGHTGTMNGAAQWPTAAAAIVALGLAGGLAVAAFSKLFGSVFLGHPRSDAARNAHESPRAMLVPMTVLAALCVGLGIAPALVAPLVDGVVATWWSELGDEAPSIVQLAPLRWLPLVSLPILGLSAAGFWMLRRATVQTSAHPGIPSGTAPGTWDCGYAAPSPRMQYTGSSFAQLLIGLFSWALRPRVARTRLREMFPDAGAFRSDLPDTVLDRAVLPTLRVSADFLRRARLLQQGHIQVYVLYVVLTVLALLLSMTVM